MYQRTLGRSQRTGRPEDNDVTEGKRGKNYKMA